MELVLGYSEFPNHIGNVFFAIELQLRYESDKAIARQALSMAYGDLKPSDKRFNWLTVNRHKLGLDV